MQRPYRITLNRDFSRIHQEGRTAVNRLLVIRTRDNGRDYSRFGFVVSKRIGNAVTRNSVKRRLREIIRQTPTQGGRDVVFIARKGAENADYHQLKRAADNLLRRAKLSVAPPDRE